MRLIDADELRSGLFHLEGETGITDRQLGYQAGWNDALMYGVLDAPTVDAVEVVRCKDCKFINECLLYSSTADKNGYCVLGERRKDETD